MRIDDRKHDEALKTIITTIANCEKIQPKFKEGSAQHTLLVHRIKALRIGKALLEEDSVVQMYTKDELCAAVAPVTSIIHKCEHGQHKHDENSPYYRRFERLISAMKIIETLLNENIQKRDDTNEM